MIPTFLLQHHHNHHSLPFVPLPFDPRPFHSSFLTFIMPSINQSIKPQSIKHFPFQWTSFISCPSCLFSELLLFSASTVLIFSTFHISIIIVFFLFFFFSFSFSFSFLSLSLSLFFAFPI